MSQRDVERSLGRLLTDERFQHDFFRDPARACLPLGLQLTPQEREALLLVPRPALTRLAGSLDERIRRIHLEKTETTDSRIEVEPATSLKAAERTEPRS